LYKNDIIKGGHVFQVLFIIKFSQMLDNNKTGHTTLTENVFLNKFEGNEAEWLASALAKLEAKSKSFPLLLSLVDRKISAGVLGWTAEELDHLNTVYPTFERTQWTKKAIASTILLLAIPPADKEIIEGAFDIAEMEESAILYKSLYFLRNAEAFIKRFEEGIRTNMNHVIDALSANNPFPAQYLSEHSWNQLILKNIFTERPLYKIYQLDEHKNEALAGIATDFIYERWSAHRQVTPEIWRLIQGYQTEKLMQDFEQRDKSEVEERVFAVLSENKENDPSFWDEVGLSTEA